MRKKTACSIVIIILLCAVFFVRAEKEIPLKNLLKRLEASQIDSISIYYCGKKTKLSEEDAAEVVRQISRIEITGEETQDCFDAAQWQGIRFPVFHIKRKNNMEFDFSPCYPFYIIGTKNIDSQTQNDSIRAGYWIEGDKQEAICCELSQTYMNLLEKYFPEI